jgi:hypothetical protein
MHTRSGLTKMASVIPLLGSLGFATLYVVATFYYPGGSMADKHARGFSWQYNFWCNLLNEQAINGNPNPARPVAFAALFLLFLSMIVFWIQVPPQLIDRSGWRKTVQVCGTASMLVAIFIYTPLHDAVIDLSGVLGLVALIGLLVGLFARRARALFVFGLANLLLIGLNNLFYYGEGLLIYLPVLQKISFCSFLLWVSLVSLRDYKLRFATSPEKIS